MSDLVQRLRACADDPMWADHAEVPKKLCAAAAAEIERLRKDAERYRALREGGALLKLYVYEDDGDLLSGDWKYKPSPEEVDAFADAMR